MKQKGVSSRLEYVSPARKVSPAREAILKQATTCLLPKRPWEGGVAMSAFFQFLTAVLERIPKAGGRRRGPPSLQGVYREGVLTGFFMSLAILLAALLAYWVFSAF
jgi:hypothetical protein